MNFGSTQWDKYKKYVRTVDIFPTILELTCKKYEGKIDRKKFL